MLGFGNQNGSGGNATKMACCNRGNSGILRGSGTGLSHQVVAMALLGGDCCMFRGASIGDLDCFRQGARVRGGIGHSALEPNCFRRGNFLARNSTNGAAKVHFERKTWVQGRQFSFPLILPLF